MAAPSEVDIESSLPQHAAIAVEPGGTAATPTCVHPTVIEREQTGDILSGDVFPIYVWRGLCEPCGQEMIGHGFNDGDYVEWEEAS